MQVACEFLDVTLHGLARSVEQSSSTNLASLYSVLRKDSTLSVSIVLLNKNVIEHY